MEPTDLNASSRDDQRLAAMLRDAQPAVADDGFSARVLAALPSPKPSTAAWRSRPLVCICGALVGSAFAWKLGMSSLSFDAASAELRASFLAPFVNDAPFALTGVGIAFVVTAASLLYAFAITPKRT